MLTTTNRAVTRMAASLILFSALVITAALPLMASGQKKPTKPKPATHANTVSAATLALGKKTYDANGCATCHVIAGKGGAAGPDLSHEGDTPTHTPTWLAEQVANPKAHNPGSSMPGFAQSIKGAPLTALATYLASLKEPPTSSGGGGTKSAGAGPNPAAVAQIEKLGGSIQPIAQNDDHLDINLHLAGAAVTDASLSALSGLKNVVHLDLGQTPITDAGLARIKGLTGLTELHLEGTKITDAGLATLQDMHALVYLNLYGTGITDAGLEHLSHLTNLRHLYVWQTKVTDEGVNKLKKALPQLEVVQGWDTAPKK